MKKDTLIEHKEAIIVCEEKRPVSLNYNVLLTTPKANIIIKHVILIVTTKSTLTCTNCGKTCHTLKTCHNRKKKRY
jgi:7-cyano-7-deazaguanine synthase in queuosine biosynthesis